MQILIICNFSNFDIFCNFWIFGYFDQNPLPHHFGKSNTCLIIQTFSIIKWYYCIYIIINFVKSPFLICTTITFRSYYDIITYIQINTFVIINRLNFCSSSYIKFDKNTNNSGYSKTLVLHAIKTELNLMQNMN